MTQAAATRLFSRYAQDYDADRRRVIPPFHGFYGAAVDALAVTGRPLERVLDLGAGTGLLSEAVLAAHPGAQVELLDGSAEMLAQARGRLGPAIAAVHLADLRAPLPEGPFDAIVSGLAIHHLEHAEQRALMARVLSRLRPGGPFVNAEMVAGPTAAATARYEQLWERQARAAGAEDHEIAGARERMRLDRCVDGETHLAWLREAGYADVDCVFRSWRFAVLAGWRPPG